MTEEKVKCPLIEEMILVKPIPTESGYLYENTGRTRLPGSKNGFRGLPRDPVSKKYVEPLTKKEREWFETEGGFAKGALEANNPGGCPYWNQYSIVLRGDETLTLRLADKGDFLRFGYLKAQVESIAPSWEERKSKLSYSHALVNVSNEVDEKATKVDKQSEAYMYLGEIRNSIPKMKGFLSMYLRKTKSRKKVPIAATAQYLTTEIGEVIKKDVEGFLSIKNVDNLDIKLFIEQCIDAGVILRADKNQYQIPGFDEPYSVGELSDFLEDKKNQLTYGKLKAQLDAIK